MDERTGRKQIRHKGRGTKMGSAYKCDRCGRLYEKSIVISKKRFKLSKLDDYRCKQMDLCESCLKSLCKWWDAGAHEAD